MIKLVNVVANYPRTLGFGIEKNLVPVRQWLLDLGLSEDQVVDVVTSFPIILGLRIEQNLKPKQALLVSAFGTSQKLQPSSAIILAFSPTVTSAWPHASGFL